MVSFENSLSLFEHYIHFQNQHKDGDGDDFSICVFPEHRDFVTICRDAEAQARRTGQKAHFWWRGYRGTVAANLPPITVPGMEMRLMNALEKITNKSSSETMVIIIKYFFFVNLSIMFNIYII